MEQVITSRPFVADRPGFGPAADRRAEPWSGLLALFLAAAAVFRLWWILRVAPGLAPDEAYFWTWAQHPAWGYYDMGPTVAWIIRAGTALLGSTEIGVRVGAVALSAGTSYLMYRLAAELFQSPRIGFTAAVLFNLTPLGNAGSVIMTYYSPHLFFWALSLYCARRAVVTGRAAWWTALGVSCGLGLLSHHTFLVRGAEIGLYLLLSVQGRPWLRRKEPYAAAALAFLIFLPCLLWNVHHDMAMFRHGPGQLGGHRSVLRVLGDYIGGQAAVASPFVFLGVVGALVAAIRRALVLRDDRWLFLAATSVPTFLFIAGLCFGHRTEANWPSPAYVSGVIALAAWFHTRRRVSRWPAALAITAVATALLMSGVTYFPSSLHAVYDLPPQRNPTNRLYGWRQLGSALSELRASMPGSFLCALDYGLTSEIAFYTAGHPPAYYLPLSYRRSQFDYETNVNVEKGRDAIYVKYGDEGLQPDVRALFDRVDPPTIVTIRESGPNSPIRKIFALYPCHGFHGATPVPGRGF